ncbi:MAG: hypothetical protein IPO58_12465, partial [Betaproteobacteria bacterium]|nr:hypothetical protein [Betaproteobacteria bacterium]
PPKSLNDRAEALYDLVVKRFLAVFYPAAGVPEHHAHHAGRGEPSSPRARQMVNAGWLAVHGKEA